MKFHGGGGPVPWDVAGGDVRCSLTSLGYGDRWGWVTSMKHPTQSQRVEGVWGTGSRVGTHGNQRRGEKESRSLSGTRSHGGTASSKS